MKHSVERLTARRDELRARIAAIHRDIGGGLEKDFEEQAIQLENLEVLQEIVRVAEQELREVEMKLAQLQSRQPK
jgi:DNA-binding response OmpR family regulator